MFLSVRGPQCSTADSKTKWRDEKHLVQLFSTLRHDIPNLLFAMHKTGFTNHAKFWQFAYGCHKNVIILYVNHGTCCIDLRFKIIMAKSKLL